MAKTTSPIELTEDQVLYFRARRGHLAGPGAPDAAAAARAILGAQAQQLPSGLLALSQRVAGRPTAEALAARLFDDDRDLVRTWGQRDTVHIYDAATDWATVVAARGEWAPGGRGGAMPTAATVRKARALLEAADRPQTRKDLIGVAPQSYVRAIEERAGTGEAALRFAAGRLLWCLAQDGLACAAQKLGAEQAYAARARWFPTLAWPAPLPVAREAATGLARRYLAVYGPATATDVAHFFNARVGNTRVWLDALRHAGALVPVRCGDRKGLVALVEDRAALTVKPPGGARGWPLRLLPLWDSMLMAHADKRWTVPEEAERKAVWRKAAYVAATVVDRGRVVATWTHAPKARHLAVGVQPLGRWRSSRHLAAVKREATVVAAHLGLPEAEVTVQP